MSRVNFNCRPDDAVEDASGMSASGTESKAFWFSGYCASDIPCVQKLISIAKPVGLCKSCSCRWQIGEFTHNGLAGGRSWAVKGLEREWINFQRRWKSNQLTRRGRRVWDEAKSLRLGRRVFVSRSPEPETIKHCSPLHKRNLTSKLLWPFWECTECHPSMNYNDTRRCGFGRKVD